MAIITLASCKPEHSKDYLTFSGKLENNTDSVLVISSRTGIIKSIAIDKDGNFKDTLKVDKGEVFSLSTPTKRAVVFLKNGYDLTLNADATTFMDSFVYSGNGAASNQFILSQIAFSKKAGNPMDLFSLDKATFESKSTALINGLDSILKLHKGVDSTLTANAEQQRKQMADYFKNNYEAQHTAAVQKAESLKKLAKGKPSPEFTGYQNFKGGKSALKDFKGTYVYIDLWATWCKPCLAEIPALKSLEKEYHKKNITFVSISIDSERTSGSWENANKKWKQMITDKSLSGVQLFAGKDIDFAKEYQVTGIPRFILIDPKGTIVESNAPRPSDPRLISLFKELGI